MQGKKYFYRSCELLWDLWCIGSVVGIWPRFVEPRLLSTTRHDIAIPDLPWDLQGLRILQFSDLHLGAHSSPAFLRKLSRRCHELQPDLLLFTGDFICYSELVRNRELSAFLNSLSAPYGCYAVFGNHDYASYAGIKESGEYGIIEDDPPHIVKGFKRLLRIKSKNAPITAGHDVAGEHAQLRDLVMNSPFRLLENETVQVTVGKSQLNICGLGDLFAGQFSPEKAYAHYNASHPGVVLSHNPDTLPILKDYPGDFILCGHTHGGQVNLPWIRDKLMVMEHKEYRAGLFDLGNKSAYVNRGVGAVIPFRWFAPPELSLFTLKRLNND